MELVEAVRKLRTEVTSLTQHRAELLETLEQVEKAREAALAQLTALEQVARRYEPTEEDELVAAFWPTLNRQDAILNALDAIGAPAHLSELREFLVRNDRDDTVKLISAALSTLRRKGLVEKLGGGVWRSPTTAVEAGSESPILEFSPRLEDTG